MKTSNHLAIAILTAAMFISGIGMQAQTNRSANSKGDQHATTVQQSNDTRNQRRHTNVENRDNNSSSHQNTSGKDDATKGNSYQNNYNENQYGKSNGHSKGNASHNGKRDNNGNHYGQNKQDNNDKHYDQNKQGNNGNHYGQRKNDENSHNGHYNNNYDTHNGKNGHSHNNKGHYDDHMNYQHQDGHHQHDNYPSNTYCQRLPGKKYHHYQFHGESYYHSDGLFYKYYPRYGYYRVKCPYIIVSALPPRIMIRYYNGQRLAYYQGHYYVPIEYGWMLVPEVDAPQFSMNISVNF